MIQSNRNALLRVSSRGFGDKWISWISKHLRSAKVAILVNGEQEREIVCKQGLRQGDPLSLLIFVLVANGPNLMIKKCMKARFLQGLGRDPTNSVINLHYIDDTLTFRKVCPAQAMILKWILYC